MEVKEDSYKTENRNRPRKRTKIHLMRTVKLSSPIWRARREDQCYGLSYLIKREERNNSKEKSKNFRNVVSREIVF